MRGPLDPGPDLVRHELHGAPGERWIGPVVARVEQCAERADLVAECKNLVRDALGGSRDYETLDAPLRRELGIRLVGKVAHDVQRARLRELGPHDVEVEVVRAVLAMHVAMCRGLVIGHENAARHAPPGSIGTEARRSPAFQVVLNVGPDDVRTHVGRRDSGPAARSRGVRSLSVRSDRGDGDGRMGLLQRSDSDTHSDVPIERALRGGPVELAFDPVRRLFAPDPAHVLERLLGLAISIRAQISDGFCVTGNAGSDSQDQSTLHQVVHHRDLRCHHRRVVVGERKHAGTEGDRRARIGEIRNESEARGDRLGRVDEMLADEGLAVAEPVGEHDRFAILAKNVPIGTGRRVDGLDEESELQGVLH